MKKLIILLVFTSFLSFSYQQISAQETTAIDSTCTHLKTVAQELMISSRYCALITVDDNGQPIARTMDPFAPDSNFVVWFGTKSNTRKIKQINNNPVVTLYYYHSEAYGYVTLYGKAYIIDNSKEKANRWKVEWEQFYTEGLESYKLIKFIPEWFQVYSPANDIYADPDTWATPEVTLQHK